MKSKILYIFIFLFIVACNNEKKQEETPADIVVEPIISEEEQKVLDSLERVKLINSYDKYDKINYEMLVIEDRKHLKEVLSKYGFSKENRINNRVFITLNRKESRYLKVGDTIVVPDKIVDDNKAYSCFPHYYPEAKDLEKLIVVSNYYQSYACYEKGVLVRFAACNTGKERTPTFPGRYALVWKDKKRRSSLDSTWIMPFTYNFHRYAGNAFHQYDMPGYAASHSCIRQFLSDAEWLFNWGKGVKVVDNKQVWLSGTPVIIVGVPDYSLRHSGPWSFLKNNKERPIVLDYDPMQVEEALIPFSQIPESIRNWIPQKERYKYAEDTLRKRGIISEDTELIVSVDFNKLRREKKKAEAKKKKQDSLKNAILPQKENSKTDLELIKEKLKELDNSKDTTKR